ncbi:hypothetical protein [Streptomyces exfoliatus]|uniref:hypothetical protein n=1 Tax=Streptomyces exfoliatus TaxID=1905 RepID=UPI003C2B9751
MATVRQAVHRARKHVQARRRHFEPADTATAARIIGQFMTAATTGDVQGLLALLAKDATLTTAAAKPWRLAGRWWERSWCPHGS